MPVNLIELCQNYFSDDVVNEAAALVNENPTAVKSAINQIIPVFLSGLAEYESSDQSGKSILELISASPINTGMLNDLASIFNNKENTNRLTTYGEGLLNNVFGIKLSNTQFSISQANDIHLTSAKTLMSLVAPTILGILNNHESIVGLSGKELLDSLAARGFTKPSSNQQKTSFARENNSAKPKSNLSWLAWLVALVIVVFLIGYLVKGCNHIPNTPAASDTTSKTQKMDNTQNAHADTAEKPSDTSGENPY